MTLDCGTLTSLDAIVQNQLWETPPGQPEPKDERSTS